jgi:hypothetical protein
MSSTDVDIEGSSIELSTPTATTPHPDRPRPQLILVHGTVGKDAGDWTEAINNGLRRAGLPSVDERNTAVTALTYWHLLRERPSGPPGFAPSHAIDERARSGYLERQSRILQAFPRDHLGPRGHMRMVDPRDAGAIMRGGREKPFSKVFPKSRLENANRYRKRRTLILDRIQSELPHGDLVIVAHSLGSVVAADLLPRLDRKHHVRCLLTIGSPLAARGTWTGTVRPLQRQYPYDRVDAWVNFMSPTDVLTAFRGLHSRGLPAVDLVTRRAPRLKDSHDIEAYVTDPVFVDVLDRALAGAL